MTTVLDTYPTIDDDRAYAAYQYLNLTVNDPFKVGKGGYFYLYGRLADEFNANEDTKSRLYAAFLKFNNVFDGTDLLVGRQFINTTADSAVMDGVEISSEIIPKRMNVRVFAGGDVGFDRRYERGDWLYGGAVNLRDIAGAEIGVSYMETRDNWRRATQFVGLDIRRPITTKATVYGEARYDIISDVVDTILVGTKIYVTPEFKTTFEYYRNIPVFDATDIYSVFAVEDYEEAYVRAEYALRKNISLFASYVHEFYDNSEDTDNVEAGLFLHEGLKYDIYAAALYRNGLDDNYGGKLSGHYYAGKDLRLGAGIESDFYRRFEMEDRDSSSRYFADIQYRFDGNKTLYGKLEGINSVYEDNELRARVRFSYAF